jgi:hypothetical protein
MSYYWNLIFSAVDIPRSFITKLDLTLDDTYFVHVNTYLIFSVTHLPINVNGYSKQRKLSFLFVYVCVWLFSENFYVFRRDLFDPLERFVLQIQNLELIQLDKSPGYWPLKVLWSILYMCTLPWYVYINELNVVVRSVSSCYQVCCSSCLVYCSKNLFISLLLNVRFVCFV